MTSDPTTPDPLPTAGGADPATLVARLEDPDLRFSSYQALVALGVASLPAIRAGLNHPRWEVRKWCAMCLDQVADTETLDALVPLLRDPNSQVRLWAVHSVACDHCKEDAACSVDLVPLLIERIEEDPSIRVRRMATIMLGTDYPDVRAIPVLSELLEAEDRKLRLHATRALDRYGQLGLTSA